MVCGAFTFRLLVNYWQKVFLKVILKPISMPERGAESYYLYSTYFEKIPASSQQHLAVILPLRVSKTLWLTCGHFSDLFLLHSGFISVVFPLCHRKKEASTPRRHTGFKSNKIFHHTTIAAHFLSLVPCTSFRQISHKAEANPSQVFRCWYKPS